MVDTLFDADADADPDADAGRDPAQARQPRDQEQQPDQESRPLAARLRPRTLQHFVGQSHLLGEKSGLRTAIEQGKPHSMILYGPPGTGKTTLARMVAEHSQAVFEELSAVQAGRAEVRAVIERAVQRRRANGRHTVFFLDEIHRFNKAQQDALLPAVEEGVVTLIGATTENPAFEVNGALLSRMRVYALQALSAEEVETVLRRAAGLTAVGAAQASDAQAGDAQASDAQADDAQASDAQADDTAVGAAQAGEARSEAARGGEARGRGARGGTSEIEKIQKEDKQEEGRHTKNQASTSAPVDDDATPVDDDAISFLAVRSGGDARTALNALELAIETAGELGEARVTLARVEDALQRRAILYDQGGDRHYDYISAWIKATRGSDPDASLYYLAVMLEGGEDARFIARRMVILASEDIGNADPGALPLAVAAAHAVEHVGLPEARYALAQAAIYLALAPKSNAAGRALGAASQHVREHGSAPVPAWLRSGPRPGQDVGGYDYPHDRPGHLSEQELLPESVVGARFYAPDEAESALAQELARVRKARGR
ncbi:MAG TPA: replication-associated recombination protein A [Solirubrobacteraceae bacterium]|nr:replication-associated recombination protein A [Solirubrobacteraceae bacterium]